MLLKIKRMIGWGILIAITFCIAYIWLAPTPRETPEDFYNAGREARINGNYVQALEDFLNFYDLSFRQQSIEYQGLRHSFFINEWKELASVYPPAKEAMINVRNLKETQLRSGDVTNVPYDPIALKKSIPSGNPEKVNRLIAGKIMKDVYSLNNALHQPERTVQLFEFIDQHYPDIATSCWPIIREWTIDNQRYDLVKKYMPNLATTEFQRIKKHYYWIIEVYRENPELKSKNRNFEDEFVNDAARLIKLALDSGQCEQAEIIAAEAQKVVEAPRLITLLRDYKPSAVEPKSSEN